MTIINHMVEYNENLSELLKAVSDTTRRSLLTRLCQQGPGRVHRFSEFLRHVA